MTAVVPEGTVDPVLAVSRLQSAAAFANNTWGPKANLDFVVDPVAIVSPELLSSPGVEDCSNEKLGEIGNRITGSMAAFMCASAAGEASSPYANALQLALSPNVLHEAGHYFGLGHVFSGWQFDSNFAAYVTPILDATPEPSRPSTWLSLTESLFDGDGLADTGTSTSAGIPVELQTPPTTTQDTCTPTYTGTMQLPMSDGTTFVGTYSPDRTNIMSYFRFCNGAVAGQYDISPSQVQIVDATLFAGSQRHLLGPALQWSPWTTIPGATGRGLGAAVFSNELFLFASGNGSNDFIYFNQAPPNQPFIGWDVAGGASDTPVAATPFRDFTYLFTKGLGADHSIYFNVLVPGQGFIGWGNTGGVTDTTVATAVFRDEIYFFAKGDGADTSIYFNSALWQQPWNGWRAVGGATDAPLAAAEFDDKLYLFARGAGSNQYYQNVATSADSFPGWAAIPSVLDPSSNVIPTGALAATAFNGRLYLFARGTDNRLYFNSALPQQSFGVWYPVPGGIVTDVTPAVAAFNNQLWIATKDTSNQFQFTTAAAF